MRPVYFSPDPDNSGGSSSSSSSTNATKTPSNSSSGNGDTSSSNTSSGNGDTSSSDTSSGNSNTSATDASSTGSSSGDSSSHPTQDQNSNAKPVSAGGTDSEGFKVLDSGSWKGSASLQYQGGQVMHFQVKNTNVLGTILTINSNLGGNKSSVILPLQTFDMRFDCFGSEPMGWTLDVSTDSDAFIVAWTLFSSWIPGDPPNG